MARFNLEDYAQVKERIAEFYQDYPQGTIRTFLAKMDGPEVIFEARIFRTQEEHVQGAYTSGWAREVEGETPVNKTSHLENCETSAVGRALANLNYCGTRNGTTAPRPSREEMQKVQRMGNGTAEGATEKQIGYLRNLIKSSAFTDEERASMETMIDNGLTKAKAKEAIDRAQAKTDKHKSKVAA